MMKTEEEAERAIEKYSDMVRRICLLHLKNHHDTEDIFQTVFLKYVLFPNRFESEEHEKAWLIRVTINSCKDTLKSFFRRNVVGLEEVFEHGREDENSEVLDAVLRLPEKYRDAVYLFYYEGYSAVEISRIKSKTVNTVYTWLDRARELLKESLGGEEL